MLVHLHAMCYVYVLVGIIRGCSTYTNFTRLMWHHMTLCGPRNFCNITQFNFPTFDINVFENQKVCPECYCDNLCFDRGDCCPDKYFSFNRGLICYNVTIVNATKDKSRDQRSSFLMVKKCPTEGSLLLKENCERDFDSIDKLRFPPVTGIHSNITYANKFCAKCNSEKSFSPWNLDIFCQEFLDVNFLSSFEEVIENGMEKHCIIQYALNDDEKAFNCNQLQKYHFDSCNVTGFWKRKDDVILHACESNYVNFEKYALYKNTFCRICNPTFYKGEAIARCNVTEMWDFYDETIQQACIDFDLNEGSLPYKNVFCRQCNLPKKMKQNFADASATVNTEVLSTTTGSDIYYTYINMKRFLLRHLESVENKVPEFEKKSKPRTLDTIRRDNKILNVSHLIYKGVAIEGSGKACENHGIPESLATLLKQCSCEPSCFYYNDCCEDFELQYPTVCVQDKRLSGEKFRYTGKEILVTNGCFMQGRYPAYLKKFCHHGRKDLFSTHPVRDVSTDVSYLNMYCFLCNNSPTSTRFKLGKPWDIEFYCPKYIEPNNFVMMERLIKTIADAKCNVTYLPFPTKGTKYPKIAFCPPERVKHDGKCNSTGEWPVQDHDVQYACENLPTGALPLYFNNNNIEARCEFRYKNKFCALCNPKVSQKIMINKCNITGNVTKYDEKYFIGCSFFPEINFHWPYKNVLCKICNDAYQTFGCMGETDYFSPNQLNGFPFTETCF